MGVGVGGVPTLVRTFCAKLYGSESDTSFHLLYTTGRFIFRQWNFICKRLVVNLLKIKPIPPPGKNNNYSLTHSLTQIFFRFTSVWHEICVHNLHIIVHQEFIFWVCFSYVVYILQVFYHFLILLTMRTSRVHLSHTDNISRY